MMELEPLDEKSNKRIDPRRCEATLLYEYFSLYEMSIALELDSYKRSKNEIIIPLII
jgi:hypothetical protein